MDRFKDILPALNQNKKISADQKYKIKQMIAFVLSF